MSATGTRVYICTISSDGIRCSLVHKAVCLQDAENPLVCEMLFQSHLRVCVYCVRQVNDYYKQSCLGLKDLCLKLHIPEVCDMGSKGKWY